MIMFKGKSVWLGKHTVKNNNTRSTTERLALAHLSLFASILQSPGVYDFTLTTMLWVSPLVFLLFQTQTQRIQELSNLPKAIIQLTREVART